MMLNKEGLIIEEIPHQRPRSVWSVLNEKEFIKKVNEVNRVSGNCEKSTFDLNSFDGCKDYLSEDLRRCFIHTYSDFQEDLAKFKTDSKLKEHALFLEWIKKEEE
jgi:hypothetical protein